MGGSEKLTVVVDKELEDIVPGYLSNRQKDLVRIPQALADEDFNIIRTLGHRMKGSGAGYGFPPITEIGKQIEEAAKGSDSEQITQLVAELSGYLEKIDVVYEVTS
ncbi:MAG: Hpt domain-containing protein [Magnetococcales bacterium]|nr:Hpt domain-containing protein [Magnetococcales bacterium]